MMLGLAVGIDSALFVVSRYREERAHGRAPKEAAGLAAGTAGPAVVAGLTVVVAQVHHQHARRGARAIPA